jgi:hypothetical protein
MCNGNDNCGCGKPKDIKCHKLCAERIKADHICADSLTVENEIAENICVSGMLQASQAFSDKSNTNSLCAVSANIGSACISDLKVANIDYCEKYRAAVTVAAPMSYVLGSNIDWNVVLDDPNSNISFSPFSYTVPVAGYYLLTYYLASSDLKGSDPIAGIPIGLLTVLVNGNVLRQFNSAYLSFSLTQDSNLSALVLLNAGDIIQMNYQVQVMNPNTGYSAYVGTVNINGNGLFPGGSGFEIHYLSSLNCFQNVCAICPEVVIPCKDMIGNGAMESMEGHSHCGGCHK